MTAPRLAVFHTVAGLVDSFKAKIAEHYSDLDSFHVVDESLLQDLIRNGPSDGITDRVVQQAVLAEKAGATAILFTCSSTSPAIDTARKGVGIPIIKIDDAMAAMAVRAGRRIGVVCTTNSTVLPSRDLLSQHASDSGRQAEIEVCLVDGAFESRASGNQDRHDALVMDAATAIAGRSDVIVLAQASLAHLQPDLADRLDVPVFASPDLCVADIGKRLNLPRDPRLGR